MIPHEDVTLNPSTYVIEWGADVCVWGGAVAGTVILALRHGDRWVPGACWSV